MKLIPSIPQETDDVTSDFDNIVENAKDCGILFILLLAAARLPFIVVAANEGKRYLSRIKLCRLFEISIILWRSRIKTWQLAAVKSSTKDANLTVRSCSVFEV